MRKLGCYQVIRQSNVVTHTIDTDKLMSAIIEQHMELVNLYHLRDGERVLIGPAEFAKLAGESINQQVSFNLQYKWDEGFGAAKVCGMPITVIPWMEGILVVPKEISAA